MNMAKVRLHELGIDVVTEIDLDESITRALNKHCIAFMHKLTVDLYERVKVNRKIRDYDVIDTFGRYCFYNDPHVGNSQLGLSMKTQISDAMTNKKKHQYADRMMSIHKTNLLKMRLQFQSKNLESSQPVESISKKPRYQTDVQRVVPEKVYNMGNSSRGIYGDEYENRLTLHGIYGDECGFALWVLQKQDEIDKKCPSTRVFYPKGASLEQVKNIVLLRDPTDTKETFHLKTLCKHFHCAEPAYKYGMPNISIYCETPVKINNGNVFANVKVLSVMTLRLGYKKPDSGFMPFNSMSSKSIGLTTWYKSMWNRAFEACSRVKATVIVIPSKFGENTLPEALQNLFVDINTLAIKYASDLYKSIKVVELCENIEDPNMSIPGIVGNIDWCRRNEIDLETTVWINDSCPTTLLGNRNGCEQSINGRWGMSSAIAVLGWPNTNKYMMNEDAWVELNS
jgi:hypothetical protein